MKHKIPVFIFIILTIMVIAGALMCIFWLPAALAYMAKFLPCAPLGWICGVIAVPFFVILLSAFAFPGAVARDSIFSPKTAKLIHGISIALFVDCLLLAVLALRLLCAGENLLSPALVFVALIGVTVACMLFILARYVDCAAILKEEADATL